MSEKYQQIKDIFSGILESEILKEICIKDYTNKTDYVKAVYSNVTKNKYAEMKKNAIQFLEIPHSKLDDLLIEIICSNLYCDLALILQIVGNKRKIKEYYYGEIAGTDANNKKVISKLEGRLKPDRLNKKEELKTISDSEHVFYAPTVIKAYKEALFVKRSGTDILDISTVFIDIFKALFCEAKEDSKNVRLIRTYRLWKFTPETICEVTKIYKQVLSSENAYKYAEIVFLEKLFGLLTLNEILSKGFNKKELTHVTTGMGKMNTLGYSSMTRLIASKINYKNHHIYEDVITQYVYPLCSECITAILYDVITYIATIKIEERETIVAGLLNACSRKLVQFPSNDLLKSIEYYYTMDAFKTLFDLPKDLKKKEHEIKALKIYLSSQQDSYSCDEEIDEDIKTTSIVNDMSYESFFRLHYITYPDFDNEEKPKFSRRIKY